MVSCRILMFILVSNIGIEASHFTKSKQYQPLDHIATLMESLEKIDRRISSSSKEVQDDFSRFRMKVRREYAWNSDISATITSVKSLIEISLWALVFIGLIGFILFFWRLLSKGEESSHEL